MVKTILCCPRLLKTPENIMDRHDSDRTEEVVLKKKTPVSTERGSVFRSDILQTLYREILNWPGSMNSTKRRNSKNKTQNSHSSTLYCCTSERKFIHCTCFSKPLCFHFYTHIWFGGISKLNPNSCSWKCTRALMAPSFKIYWFVF